MDYLDDSSRTLSGDSVTSDETLVAEQDDLNDNQINFLLNRAVMRAKARANERPLYKLPEISAPKLPQLKAASILPAPYSKVERGVAKTEQSRMVDQRQRKLAELPKKVEDPLLIRKSKKEPKSALADWYNMPRTDLTPGLKRDLQLLHMRSVIDPKRMYKKQGKFKVPEYSQMGVVVEGPTEYFNGRIEKKQRKRTFVEEVMAGEQESGRFKNKYEELQIKKKSGKKAYYKMLQAKRRKVGKGG